MQAIPGDWLVVKTGRDAGSARRGQIRATGSNGAPPYTVRWPDTGRETLVFPGPEAQVLTAERLSHLDAQRAKRAAQVQEDIRTTRRSCTA